MVATLNPNQAHRARTTTRKQTGRARGDNAVQTTDVEFFSEGDRIAALWRTPDTVDGPLRAIVQGPGWLGLKDANLYVR